MEHAPAADRLVVLHIGLPRMETVFLRDRVLARTPGLTLVHRRLTPEHEGLIADLRRYARAPGLLAPLLRHRVGSGLRAATPRDPGTLLVSDENIAVDAHSLWRDRGPSPEQVAARLARLASVAAPLGQLRVLIEVRRQDAWLAARYAASSRHYSDFNQVDFDRRMARLRGTETLSGPWRWADFATVEQSFAAELGVENVMLLSRERMVAAPVRSLRALGRFLGVRIKATPLKRWALRQDHAPDAGAWMTRTGGPALVLKADVRDMVLERFAPANAELAARAELGF